MTTATIPASWSSPSLPSSRTMTVADLVIKLKALPQDLPAFVVISRPGEVKRMDHRHAIRRVEDARGFDGTRFIVISDERVL